MKQLFKAKKEGGFTLIEVVLAMGLFAIGSLAIATLFFTTSKTISKSQALTSAVFMAEDYLTRALQTPYSGLSTSTAVGSFIDGIYTVNVGVSPILVSGNPTGTTRININVTWSSGILGANNTYNLEYIRAETRSSGI